MDGQVNMDGAGVFPTRVGVNRVPAEKCLDWIRIPHTRGGEPYLCPDVTALYKYSPHAWG